MRSRVFLNVGSVIKPTITIRYSKTVFGFRIDVTRSCRVTRYSGKIDYVEKSRRPTAVLTTGGGRAKLVQRRFRSVGVRRAKIHVARRDVAVIVTTISDTIESNTPTCLPT